MLTFPKRGRDELPRFITHADSFYLIGYGFQAFFRAESGSEVWSIVMARKIAIIIAIEHYRDDGIKNVMFALDDAKAMSASLAAVGFKEQLILTDDHATKSTIQERIKDLVSGLSEEDSVYVFFAGHGVSIAGSNYLLCYDTDHRNVQNTAVPLQWLLDKCKSPDCDRVVVFLDACQSDLPIDESMRASVSGLSDKEIEVFLKEGKHSICFCASSGMQASHSSRNLKHGIWTYYLLKALDGDIPDEFLREGHYLTSNTLQNYLAREVPVVVRQTHAGVNQNPKAFGSVEHEFLIADVSGPILARKPIVGVDAAVLKKTVMSSVDAENVTGLAGFDKKKGHTIPRSANSSAKSWITKLTSSDLENDIEKIEKLSKAQFGYIRKEMKVAAEDGFGTVLTPGFEYSVNVSLNDDDPSEVIWTRELSNLKPDIWENQADELDSVFNGVFDTLDFEFSGGIDVEEAIDHIESLKNPKIILDYRQTDLTKCKITFDDFDGTIELSESKFSVKAKRSAAPSLLLENFKTVQKLIVDQTGGSDLALGLSPAKPKALPPS